MRRARARAVAIVACGLIAIAACAAPADQLPRVVSEDEASLVADALFENYEAGGATFALSALLPSGATVVINGEIDFERGAGRAVHSSSGADQAVDEVAWLDDVVLELIPEFGPAAADSVAGSPTWVARPADPDSYDIDSLIAVVRARASPVRENPILLRQNGVQLIRTDTLRGVEVDVFQYGAFTRLWIEHGTSNLLRFEGNSSSGDRPIVVDLLDLGERTVPLPAIEETAAIQDVSDIYDQVRNLK